MLKSKKQSITYYEESTLLEQLKHAELYQDTEVRLMGQPRKVFSCFSRKDNNLQITSI